jgi:hypothetical protein
VGVQAVGQLNLPLVGDGIKRILPLALFSSCLRAFVVKTVFSKEEKCRFTTKAQRHEGGRIEIGRC